MIYWIYLVSESLSNTRCKKSLLESWVWILKHTTRHETAITYISLVSNSCKDFMHGTFSHTSHIWKWIFCKVVLDFFPLKKHASLLQILTNILEKLLARNIFFVLELKLKVKGRGIYFPFRPFIAEQTASFFQECFGESIKQISKSYTSKYLHCARTDIQVCFTSYFPDLSVRKYTSTYSSTQGSSWLSVCKCFSILR